MDRWYTLFTKPRSEFRVASALEARGLAVFVPCIGVRGRRGMTKRPFFPRYMFAQFDWETAGWSEVKWLPGLTRVVDFDGRPAFLEDHQVSHLQGRLGGIDGDEFMRIKPGEPVKVVDGPFMDLEAVFDRQLNGEQRVAILIEILGRQTAVEVHRDAIRRVA